mmetsp:Transcript_43828/g.75939  ORF Transcript_43828/g.75939 Transcript_43828/m.75939 type:complete len:188 (+) Transcript_43828:75-638(+)
MAIMHLLVSACFFSTAMLMVQAQLNNTACDPYCPPPTPEEKQCIFKTGVTKATEDGVCTEAEMCLPECTTSKKCIANIKESTRYAFEECFGDKYPQLKSALDCKLEHMCDPEWQQLWSFSAFPQRMYAQHPETDGNSSVGWTLGVLLPSIFGGILGSMFAMVGFKLAAKRGQAKPGCEALLSDSNSG